MVIQPSAHNPTGAVPSSDEYQELSMALKARSITPLFDLTYQGLASGSLDTDAQAIRLMANDGLRVVVSQSYAKNMGLYGERTGTLSILCSTREEATTSVRKQLSTVARYLYGSPPVYGAMVAQSILGNGELRELWLKDVRTIANRLLTNRRDLAGLLATFDRNRDWSYLVRNSGMFSLTGFSTEQIKNLAENYSVYLPEDGRMSLATITPGNLQHVARAFAAIS